MGSLDEAGIFRGILRRISTGGSGSVRRSSVTACVSTCPMTKINNVGRSRTTSYIVHINEAFAVVQKYLADNVFVCYYHPVAQKCDSVEDSVELAGTLLGVSVPQRRSTAR